MTGYTCRHKRKKVDKHMNEYNFSNFLAEGKPFSFYKIMPNTDAKNAKVNIVAIDKLPGHVHDPLEYQSNPLTGQNEDHKQELDLHQLL